MSEISFYVYGRPQQRGSKRAFTRRRKDGSIGVAVADMNERSREWIEQVRSAAGAAHKGELFSGAIALEVSFWFARPQSHFGTGRNAGALKDSAPRSHTQQPDLDKLLRAIGDALTGVIWRDDRQVVGVSAHKHWSGDKAMAHVRVVELTYTDA